MESLMTRKEASVATIPEPQLHPLLRNRWSPQVWDATHEVTPADVESILEAARWAPSAGNSQPWAFIVGRRGDSTHTRLVHYLARSSAAWAPDASVLVANLCHRNVAGTDWEYSEFGAYDLGQAVAHKTFQAEYLGLAARQFAAFDRDGLTREFAIADHWYLTTISAFGRIPPGVEPRAAALPNGRLIARDRRTLADLRWDASRHGHGE
jgi:nitroreductase